MTIDWELRNELLTNEPMNQWTNELVNQWTSKPASDLYTNIHLGYLKSLDWEKF